MVHSFVISGPEDRNRVAMIIGHEIMRESAVDFLKDYMETKDALINSLFYTEEEAEKLIERLNGYHRFCLEKGLELTGLTDGEFEQQMTKAILESEYSDVHKAIYGFHNFRRK